MIGLEIRRDSRVQSPYLTKKSAPIRHSARFKTASRGGFKQCFNDVLEFRLRFEEYPGNFPDYFRVVDLRRGKKIDDGYRAIHL